MREVGTYERNIRVPRQVTRASPGLSSHPRLPVLSGGPGGRLRPPVGHPLAFFHLYSTWEFEVTVVGRGIKSWEEE